MRRHADDIARLRTLADVISPTAVAHAFVASLGSRQGFFDEYVTLDASDLPAQRFADWGYPAIWWRARHGVRSDAVDFWFAARRGTAA
jgi:hypothetical protein